MVRPTRAVCSGIVWTIALVLAAAGTSTPAYAQTTNGAIVGVVTDAQAAVLPGVTVTLRNTDTGLVRVLTSETDGRYRVGGLPPGRYELTSELQGFSPVRVTDMTVVIGGELVRNVTMQVEGLAEVLTVTAEAPVVETTKAEVAGVITQQQIETLPLASRQPMALALLLPGTSQDAVRPRRANVNLGAGAFTMANAQFVDGVTNKEGNSGEPRQDFPQSAIREFRVNVSQAPAEYGWTLGGVVNMATKSGTNQYTGEAFEFFRDKSLNSMNLFEQRDHDTRGTPKPNYSRHQFGAALGGPIIHNRLHFFVTGERTKENKYVTVNTGRPDLYASLEGTFPIPEYNNMIFGRGDLVINQAQTAFARMLYQNADYTCDACGGRNSVFSNNGIRQVRYGLVGGHTWVMSSRALNDFRFQWGEFLYREHPPGAKPVMQMYSNAPERAAPLTQVYTFPSLVWGSNANFYTQHHARQIRNDSTITMSGAGSHTWKFGGGVTSLGLDQDNRPAIGTWTFTLDQPFNPSDPASVARLTGASLFTASTPSLPVYQPNMLWESYVQDEWKPVSTVTLSLGLRYDYQAKALNQGLDINDKKWFPTTGTSTQIPFVDFKHRGDWNNIGPRVGAAWDLKGNGKSVVRADYGIYYNPVLTLVVGGERRNFRTASISISNPAYPDPYGGRDPLTFASTAPQNIAIVDNTLENPQSIAYSLGMSQALSSTMALHVDGVYNDMSKVPLQVNINPRSGLTTGNRPLAQFARVDQAQSIGDLTYKAMMVRLEKRLDTRFTYLVSYTLAKAGGNVPFSGTTGRVTQSEAPELDRGPAVSDRRHALATSGAVILPADVTLSAVWTLRSSMPFSALAGVDLNGDALNTDYVPGTSRSAFGRGSDAGMMAMVNSWRATRGLAALPVSQIDSNDYNSVDMRVTKSFSLGGRRRTELVAQIFNVFGRDNLQATWQTNALSNSFGQIQQALNRRQAEIAVRFIW